MEYLKATIFPFDLGPNGKGELSIIHDEDGYSAEFFFFPEDGNDQSRSSNASHHFFILDGIKFTGAKDFSVSNFWSCWMEPVEGIFSEEEKIYFQGRIEAILLYHFLSWKINNLSAFKEAEMKYHHNKIFVCKREISSLEIKIQELKDLISLEEEKINQK